MLDMKVNFSIRFRLTAFFAALSALSTLGAASPQPNSLTSAEKAAGWKLLFDGKSLQGWHNFRKPGVTGTNAWVIEDGWIKKLANQRGGDILTKDKFDNFELTWEWRLPKGANNGIKYLVT